MKLENRNIKTPSPIKVRVKSTLDVYYTFKHWPSKEIEGVEFIGVAKFFPSNELTQQLHWMRKDGLEYIK